MRSCTFVPSGPLILDVASSVESPAIDLPSTSVIRSPGLIFARLAGVPS